MEIIVKKKKKNGKQRLAVLAARDVTNDNTMRKKERANEWQKALNVLSAAEMNLTF